MTPQELSQLAMRAYSPTGTYEDQIAVRKMLSQNPMDFVNVVQSGQQLPWGLASGMVRSGYLTQDGGGAVGIAPNVNDLVAAHQTKNAGKDWDATYDSIYRSGLRSMNQPRPATTPAPATGTARPSVAADRLNAIVPRGVGGTTPTPGPSPAPTTSPVTPSNPGPLGQAGSITAGAGSDSGGGKGGGVTRSVSASGPPDFQFPSIQKGLNEANRLYDSPGPQIYPGSIVAPFTAAEQQGQQSALNAAGGALPQLASGTMDAFKFGTTTALDPNSNPYFQNAVQGAIQPVFQQLTEQVLPNIRNSFAGAGGYGGTRQSLAEALATDATTKNALNTTAAMGSQAYGQGLQTFLNTLAQAPQIGQMQLAPASTMSAVGGQQRELENAKRMEEASKFMYGQNLPYNKLMEFMNVVSRPYGGQAASTIEAPPVGTAEQIAGMGMGLLPVITKLWEIFK